MSRGRPVDGVGAGGSGNGGAGRVFFPGDALLEGTLEWPGAAGQPAGGLVVAHPHPLHGGSMAQPVVYRIAKAAVRRNLAALRFNFRGVGASRGTFSGYEEDRDVEAAAAFLRARLAAAAGDAIPGGDTAPVALAGYSFGSVMSARAAAGPVPVKALALVGFLTSWPGLPSDTLSRLGQFRGPILVVSAEHDSFGYPDEVQSTLRSLGVDFKMVVIEGTDHFLQGRHREVAELVAGFVAEKLALERYALE